MNIPVEHDKIYGHLGRQVGIEGLPEEFIFFDEEHEGLLVHIPCATVVARFGSNTIADAILKSASEHVWCPALGSGISSG